MYERIFASLKLRRIMISKRCDKWEPYDHDKVRIYRNGKLIATLPLPLNDYDATEAQS